MLDTKTALWEQSSNQVLNKTLNSPFEQLKTQENLYGFLWNVSNHIRQKVYSRSGSGLDRCQADTSKNKLKQKM